MGVQLTRDEIDDYLTRAHTVILSSVGRDGYPHSVPMWFAYLDGAIYFRTMGHQQKALNLKRDPKACLLVEDGEAWVDLRAVMVRGDAEEVSDPAEIERFEAVFDRKYQPFRQPTAQLGDATRRHYSRPRAYFKVPLDGSRVASWYNRKVRLRS